MVSLFFPFNLATTSFMVGTVDVKVLLVNDDILSWLRFMTIFFP